MEEENSKEIENKIDNNVENGKETKIENKTDNENENKIDNKVENETENIIKSNVEIKDTDEEDNDGKSKTVMKNILEWIYCIVIAIVLALLFRYYIGTPTIVKQVSMYPTLEQNQRLWLNRWGRTTGTLPQRGEIITFEEPTKISYTESEIDVNNPVAKFEERTGWDWFINNFLEMGEKRSYIKRVIGLPGEHVQIKDGKVYINSVELKEEYLQKGVVTDVNGTGFDDFVVPNNCVFAMGDNRNHSTDCRSFGCVPLDKIESTVAFRFWPLDKFGGID